ncbi:hypothetical protein [Parachlamydia acanthamoebae]|uniref:hypothetical protein n=1 Tax=Parachlamydia acanthamoebae TaxID=83552 RepID=UPI00055E7797|nr:hypothetical protein [Parachlamydia acanthamoebae]
MPIVGIRPCGARCRTKNGDPCLQPAMKDSNRCRMHFGHARKLITHGRLTIQAEEERRQQRALFKEMKAVTQNLESVCFKA